MSPQEKSEVVRLLETSRDELLAAARGVPSEKANVRTEADRWSVLECIDHITTVEERFRGFLERPEQPKAPPVDRQKEAELAARVSSRAVRVTAPEPVQPKGRFSGLAEALEYFSACRATTIRFAEDHSAGLYQLAAEHPRFGLMNGTELLTIVASHARRHADQIREIAAALNQH